MIDFARAFRVYHLADDAQNERRRAGNVRTSSTMIQSVIMLLLLLGSGLIAIGWHGKRRERLTEQSIKEIAP